MFLAFTSYAKIITKKLVSGFGLSAVLWDMVRNTNTRFCFAERMWLFNPGNNSDVYKIDSHLQLPDSGLFFGLYNKP